MPRHRERASARARAAPVSTVNFRTNILDVRGFYSSISLILRGGIPRLIGNLPESLSQAILVRIMLVGRSGVHGQAASHLVRGNLGPGCLALPYAFAQEPDIIIIIDIYIYIYIFIYLWLLLIYIYI